ncbi:MAG: spore coat protein CotJB, partial [Ruminococcus sp.]|nr:spore coat protein CotJB [Ruminococcus sp.]
MAILSEKEKLMLQIQNCSFAMKEAELFLDTHPT